MINVCRYAAADGEDLRLERLAELTPYVLLAEGHPLAAASSISLEDLVQESLGPARYRAEPELFLTYDGRALVARPLASAVNNSRLVLATLSGRP
jgi:DNA-binding transcriptional LysR family regulator